MRSERRTSRRALLAGGGLAVCVLAVRASRSLAVADEEIKEADKIKQSDAHYQTHPKGRQRCEICLQFNPPDSCKIVRGPITLQGWCQFFAARESAR